MDISDSIKQLYRRLIAIEQVTIESKDDVSKIEVDHIVSKLALLYEKMRNTMDYNEDHLLRRFAIERNLRRRLVLESLEPKIAQSLIEELVRSGYLPNASIPETVSELVAQVIAKYMYLLELVGDQKMPTGEAKKIADWLIGIMACEIDLQLIPEFRPDALIETLYGIVKDRIKLRGTSLSERERNIQLYITIHKEIVKSDNAIISYHLLNLYFPDWISADKQLVEYVADKVTSVYYGIHNHLDNPVRKKMANGLKKHIVVFKILRGLIDKHEHDLVELFGNPEYLESEARLLIDVYNKSIRQRLRRSSIRAVLYILITKVALALLIEYPFELKFLEGVNYIALGINIIFPPLLMFLVTLSARLPGINNTVEIIKSLKALVYGEPEKNILCNVRVSRRRGLAYRLVEYIFYLALYAFIFGLIIYGLRLLKFNILSGALFIFFIAVVSFFATRIRQLAKEYSVLHTREGIISFFINFFSLPILRAGHWLSVNMQRVNLFVFILDFVIEAPFKLLVEMIESWMGLLREKRDDIYKST